MESEKKHEKDKQVELLMELTRERGANHAVTVARGLDDPYVLDRFHDEITKKRGVFIQDSWFDFLPWRREVKDLFSIRLLEARGEELHKIFEDSGGSLRLAGAEVVLKNAASRLFLLAREEKSSIAHEEAEAGHSDYTIFRPESVFFAAQLSLCRDDLISLEIPPGTLLEIISKELAGYLKEDALSLQVLLSPVSKDWQDKQKKDIIKKRSALEKFSDGEGGDGVGELDSKLEKLSKPCHFVNARLVFTSASAENVKRFEKLTKEIFKNCSLENLNSFTIKEAHPKDIVYKYIFRKFSRKEAMLLNKKEISWLLSTN